MNIPKRLTARVKLNDVLKEHIYKGKKGDYLDLVFFNTPDNQFGADYVIKQDIPQDKRPENGAPILGNAKCWDPNGGMTNVNVGAPSNNAPAETPTPANANDDNLPF